MAFKKGDKVKEKGKKGRRGIITRISRDPFYHVNVKFRGQKSLSEFHIGELKKVKRRSKK